MEGTDTDWVDKMNRTRPEKFSYLNYYKYPGVKEMVYEDTQYYKFEYQLLLFLKCL